MVLYTCVIGYVETSTPTQKKRLNFGGKYVYSLRWIYWHRFGGVLCNLCTILDTIQPTRETVVYQGIRIVQQQIFANFFVNLENCTAFPVHTVPRDFLGVKSAVPEGLRCSTCTEKEKNICVNPVRFSLPPFTPTPSPEVSGIWCYVRGDLTLRPCPVPPLAVYHIRTRSNPFLYGSNYSVFPIFPFPYTCVWKSTFSTFSNSPRAHVGKSAKSAFPAFRGVVPVRFQVRRQPLNLIFFSIFRTGL